MTHVERRAAPHDGRHVTTPRAARPGRLQGWRSHPGVARGRGVGEGVTQGRELARQSATAERLPPHVHEPVLEAGRQGPVPEMNPLPPREERLGALLHDDPAVIDERDLVGDVVEALGQVRCDEHRTLAVRDEGAQPSQEGAPDDHVEAGGRLIEQQQVRSVRQRERERQQLLLTVRQVLHLLQRVQLELVEQVVETPAVPSSEVRRGEPSVPLDRPIGVEDRVLRHVPEAVLDLALAVGIRQAEDAQRARGARRLPREDLDQRGLARAVPAEEPGHRAGLQGQRDVAQAEALVVLGDVAGLQDGLHVTSPPPAARSG